DDDDERTERDKSSWHGYPLCDGEAGLDTRTSGRSVGENALVPGSFVGDDGLRVGEHSHRVRLRNDGDAVVISNDDVAGVDDGARDGDVRPDAVGARLVGSRR